MRVTRNFASGRAGCDRDKCIVAVPASAFVTVTTKQFEMVQYITISGLRLEDQHEFG